MSQVQALPRNLKCQICQIKKKRVQSCPRLSLKSQKSHIMCHYPTHPSTFRGCEWEYETQKHGAQTKDVGYSLVFLHACHLSLEAGYRSLR